MKHVGKNLFLQILVAFLSIFTAVHENVVFSRMSVEVAVEDDPDAILFQFGDHLLGVEHGGESFL